MLACSPLVGSWAASLVPNATMGGFSVFMTFLLGIKFIVRPVMTTKEAMQARQSAKKRLIQSVVCGMLVGFICGFVGAGGGMMMLLILTSVLGYELKTAVGTSVFIMTFTALTGAVSHFAIGGAPDCAGVWCSACCPPCCGRGSRPSSPTRPSPIDAQPGHRRGAGRAGRGDGAGELPVIPAANFYGFFAGNVDSL